ncbi:PREDICTED: sodium channel protein Nach-like [Nicrophorus vespilloides]|uniref:Sodium channel protein Nach-like n=1 Tax=Nicrophorus vespilloides TaxID=110193 RepID=A0ABM1MTE1_NICVS|nr:PREDICTED: sodium channel protein Nach-like [Nicrophorus vespilloides]
MQQRKSAKVRKSTSNYKLLKTSWEHQGRIFFEQSTLHGVRYIAETGRPLIEKFLWFMCVGIGATATVVIIISLWEKFQTNPTITGLDTDFHTWDVPFPAVTICQSVPSNESIIDDFIQRFSDMKDVDDKEKLKDFIVKLTQLSYTTINSFKDYTESHYLAEDVNLKAFVFKLMNPCDDILTECMFKSRSYNCCENFFPVFTESGYCYSFNSRHYELKSPWSDDENPPFEMKYIKETDSKWSLKMSVADVDPLYNYSIYIHNSDEIPGIESKPQHIWDYRVDKIMFSVKQTYTTEDAKQLSIKQRHCVFEHELKLKIDNLYTYSACTKQCRMDTAIKLCGCVPHFYTSDINYRQCTLMELGCISDHLKQIRDVDKCKCFLGCSNTVYEVEKLNEFGSDELTSSLETEFVSWPMVRYKREVLFGWVDLLVSFGGIAGLFLGFSLLSGVEVLYYFTIRACCMFYRNKDELLKIEEEAELNKKTDYDLSLVPYFVKKPKNQGRLDVAKRMKRRKNFNKVNIEPVSPYRYLDNLRDVTMDSFDHCQIHCFVEGDEGTTHEPGPGDSSAVRHRVHELTK